jgi:hypothetical protein
MTTLTIGSFTSAVCGTRLKTSRTAPKEALGTRYPASSFSRLVSPKPHTSTG